MSGFVSSGFSVGKGASPEARTLVMAIVGGTASELGGGKFANGAMGSVFQYMFNDLMDQYARKVAFGDPAEKAKASAGVATFMGFVSAVTKAIKIPFFQTTSTISGWMSVSSTVNAQALRVEAGTFTRDGAIVDVITTTTEYCKNPIGEFLYDETFSRGAPYFFGYGEGAQ